jgi:hypothetical protein
MYSTTCPRLVEFVAATGTAAGAAAAAQLGATLKLWGGGPRGGSAEGGGGVGCGQCFGDKRADKNHPIWRVPRCRTHHFHFASHVQPSHPQRVTTEQQHVCEEAGAVMEANGPMTMRFKSAMSDGKHKQQQQQQQQQQREDSHLSHPPVTLAASPSRPPRSSVGLLRSLRHALTAGAPATGTTLARCRRSNTLHGPLSPPHDSKWLLTSNRQ